MAKKASLHIGLAFPEIGEHALPHFEKQLEKGESPLDLLVFPEGFETAILANEGENAEEAVGFTAVLDRYQEFSEKHRLPLIVGIKTAVAETEGKSINGAEFDQYSAVIQPGRKPVIYHKHTTSKNPALCREDWDGDKNLPVVDVKGHKVGLSICHDSFLSLIPRQLKEKGAEIWVNMSYQNQRDFIWRNMYQGRAVENNMLAVSALHRNSHETNPQKEPYAYAPEGAIALSELAGGEVIGDIGDEQRTGRIYRFETGQLQTQPREHTVSPAAASEHRTVTVGKFGTVQDAQRPLKVETISLRDFVYHPEKIWDCWLKDTGSVPVFKVKANPKEWQELHEVALDVAHVRGQEFSTLFILEKAGNPEYAVWRSSNYKHVTVESGVEYPLKVDERFLFGPSKTFELTKADNNARAAERFSGLAQQLCTPLKKAGAGRG